MAESLPPPNMTPSLPGPREDEDVVIQVLNGYKEEGRQGREEGPSPRDEVWRRNWDRYWGRYDHSNKAEWQSVHVMPETPQFVDRWAAAMREALTQGGRWYRAVDDTGESDELSPHIEKLMELLLGRCSRTVTGHPTDFASFFEDQMKLGALMQCCASVTYKRDSATGRGYVACESVDPRECWFDPKGRGLYRLRSYPMDKYQLKALADQVDAEGKPLYNAEAIEALQHDLDQEERDERERASGHSEGDAATPRTQVKIDEWLCTLLDSEGEGTAIARNLLIVVANDDYIIRGPEPNPFWHKRDWIVATPMVTVPFSVYGRSYAEDWADAADAFVELTNLILDGVYTSTMRAFVVNANMLEDPTQIDEGISPNKLFNLEDGVGSPRDFLKEVELGSLPPEALTVWTALKQEMREGAKLNEIALGQVPPKGDITATEVAVVSQSGSAMIRSMVRTIEARFLEPVLTLMFQTALQHMNFLDPQVMRELGEDTAMMLEARKHEFLTRRFNFRVRGLSSLVDRQMKLRQTLSLLQTIGSNELLLQAFIQENDPRMVMRELMRLFGFEVGAFKPSEAEQRMRALTQQAQPEPGGSPPRQPSTPVVPESP